MKKFTILLSVMLIYSTVYSQLSNLVLYNQDGFRFFVILNGIKMNNDPQTNVKITDLPQPYYKVKIIFEDKSLGEVDKNLNFNPGTETVFQIKKNNKNEWTIKWQSEVPIAQAAATLPGQAILSYNVSAGIAANPNVINTPSGSVTTTTTTTSYNQGMENQVNMNLTVPGASVNINVPATATTTTSVNTYSSTTTTNGNEQHYVSGNQNVYNMPGYNGPVGCPWPMSEQDFAAAKQSIASKGFDETKLTIAKQVISSNCLFSHQVKEIMKLFSFEETRLDFAKFAYGFTYDIGNYFKLNDAFQFESSIDELNNYINTRK